MMRGVPGCTNCVLSFPGIVKAARLGDVMSEEQDVEGGLGGGLQSAGGFVRAEMQDAVPQPCGNVTMAVPAAAPWQ